MWTRIQAMELSSTPGVLVEALLDRVSLVEIVRPFMGHLHATRTTPLRTLDAMHLEARLFLRDQGTEPALPFYGRLLAKAAQELDRKLYDM